MSEFAQDSSDGMSMEERVEYLRARGVQVELPGDRRKETGAEIQKEPAEKIYIAVVKVPCNEEDPLLELKVPVEKNKAGDQLLDILGIYFKDKNTAVKMDALRKAAQTQFSNQEFTISESTVANMETSVEAFTLGQPSQRNGNKKVSFYLDEAGSLKGLPFNKRASGIGDLCGYENVQFLGDMFIGNHFTYYCTCTSVKNCCFDSIFYFTSFH